VLISQEGRPVLSDFGVSRLSVNSVTIAGTTSLKGNIRWMAPELLSPTDFAREHEFHTKATDVWAFGMVILVCINSLLQFARSLIALQEALSGKVPFQNCRNEVQVMMLVMNGKVPNKPEGGRCTGKYFDALWDCCCCCWSHNAAERPLMSELRRRLTVS
jgi:serine/threonine protein kinase